VANFAGVLDLGIARHSEARHARGQTKQHAADRLEIAQWTDRDVLACGMNITRASF